MSEPIYDFAADVVLAVRLWNEKIIDADTALDRIVDTMEAYLK